MDKQIEQEKVDQTVKKHMQEKVKKKKQTNKQTK